MDYTKFKALYGAGAQYATCFVFNAYKKDTKVFTKKNMESIGIDPAAPCNLKETPCGIRFDIDGETIEAAKKLTSLFPGKFVFACEYWNEDVNFKGYIDGEECDDIAWAARYKGCLPRDKEKPEYVAPIIDFIYRRIAFTTIPALFMPVEKAKKLYDEGNRRRNIMFDDKPPKLFGIF